MHMKDIGISQEVSEKPVKNSKPLALIAISSPLLAAFFRHIRHLRHVSAKLQNGLRAALVSPYAEFILLKNLM